MTPTTLDRLTFGRAIPGLDRMVSDPDWRAFESNVVAPRFPDGFTTLFVEGAWRDAKTGELIREPSVIVEVAHDGSEDAKGKVAAIAAAYKRAFRQDAVMLTRTPVDVSFL